MDMEMLTLPVLLFMLLLCKWSLGSSIQNLSYLFLSCLGASPTHQVHSLFSHISLPSPSTRSYLYSQR